MSSKLLDKLSQKQKTQVTSDSEYYYWEKGVNAKIGRFFRTTEFDCSCKSANCTRSRIAIDLIRKLDELRDTLDAPVRINSGFRCNDYQRDLAARGYKTAKGVSDHERGRAADLSTSNMNELLYWCNQMFKAVGAANTFVHVDLRDDKTRRWNY